MGNFDWSFFFFLIFWYLWVGVVVVYATVRHHCRAMRIDADGFVRLLAERTGNQDLLANSFHHYRACFYVLAVITWPAGILN